MNSVQPTEQTFEHEAKPSTEQTFEPATTPATEQTSPAGEPSASDSETTTEPALPRFDEIGLSDLTLEAIKTTGYEKPTPIQAGAIPPAVKGRDILGIAQTGTGKTASFVLPMLTRLETGRARARMPRSLILTPTRELAAQVKEDFDIYGAGHKLTVALLIGGVSFGDQERLLDRGADVLIATPGRLLDHFQRGKLLLSAVEIFVIDEADRMLDMGFIPDIEKISGLLPPLRQTLFFSATMPDEITRLSEQFLTAPVRVEVARQSTTANTITQHFKFAESEPRQKRAALRDIIADQQDKLKNAIIFCNRKRDVDILFKSLKKHGFNAGALHGDMDQRSRMATLQAFRDGKITLLAASDVAARGLDIPDVSHVLNYDVPGHAEDYVHRIGRTGRAGRSGYSATLVTSQDGKNFKDVTTLISIEPDWLGKVPDEQDLDPEAADRSARPARRTGRNRKSAASTGNERRNGQSANRATNQKSNNRRRSSQTDDARSAAASGEARGNEQTSARTSSSRQRPTNKRQQDAAAKTSAQKPARRGRGGRRRSNRDDDQPVIGMGDHIPAFLLRSVRP